MLKNLLVHIPSERVTRPVIDGSISLAMARNAHLKAVSIGYEASNVGLAIDGGAAVAAVFEMERERALERANAALAVFEAEARNAGIAYEVQALTGIPYETAAEISAAARLCDLAIVLQPEQARDTFDNTIPLRSCSSPAGRSWSCPTPTRARSNQAASALRGTEAVWRRAPCAMQHRSWRARRRSRSSASTNRRRPRLPLRRSWRRIWRDTG